MKERILELVNEKLLQIKDVKEQIDICQYMLDIEFFNSKVRDYKWLSSPLPIRYHDLTIGDFVSLDDKELKKIVKRISTSTVSNDKDKAMEVLDMYYYIENYTRYMNNYCDILNSSNYDKDFNSKMFAKNVLDYMVRNDVLFNAGVALFFDEKSIKREIVKEQLLKINDIKEQNDIYQYFRDIEFLSKRVSDYEWLSSCVPVKYHEMLLSNFIILVNEMLSERNEERISPKSRKSLSTALTTLRSIYSKEMYFNLLHNESEVLKSMSKDVSNESMNMLFVDTVLEYMDKSEVLFDAGVALFYNDKRVQSKSNQYTK